MAMDTEGAFRCIVWGAFVAVLLFSAVVPAKDFIDVFCPDVERKEAILTCAFQAGVEVVFLEEVKGRVNIRKDHVRFEKALSLILKGTGVSWFRADGVYYIGTPRKSLPLSLGEPSECYTLHHMKSREVIATLPEYRDVLLPEGEYTLRILGKEPFRRILLEKIRALDTPKAHVLVQALVVECKRGEAEKLGISLPKNRKSVTVGEVNLGGPFERLEALKAYLEGLREEGDFRLRSEAQILVLEGEEGEVSTTGEVYYPVREVAELERVDVGTTLKVVPRKVGDSTIHLDVALTVQDLAKNGRSELSVLKREVQASLVLPEGKVVAIAGLKQKEEGERRRRISRRRTSSQKESTEVILFLQARREDVPSRETIAAIGGADEEIVIPEFGETYEYDLRLCYASLGGEGNPSPWLGAGFSGRSEEGWELEGYFLSTFENKSKANITLRYPLKEGTYLGLEWNRTWGSSARTVYSVYIGSRGSLAPRVGWHGGLGIYLSGFEELPFVFFGLSGEEKDLSLRAGLLYRWRRGQSNLWLEAEGNLALGRRTRFFIGYRECVVGEPIDPFDEVFFRGLYAGIVFKL